MEFVEGESLFDLLQQTVVPGKQIWKQALNVAMDVTKALGFIHDRGVVHRNVTPNNILIQKSDQSAKLGDAILAKALKGSVALSLTASGESVGDIYYIAPEQTNTDSEPDCRCDFYSLGVTIYSALSGRFPFQGESLVEIISQINEKRTPALTPERVLRRLEWRVVRRLDGRLQGDYRTLFRGTGIDVADLREYQPYDDVRHIDWNVTARTDVPHVRVYDEDREVTAWLLLDRSASMGFGPVQRRKHDVLADVAGTVAQVLARGGNRIGAVLFDTGIERTIPPGHGRTQVLRILSGLMSRGGRGCASGGRG